MTPEDKLEMADGCLAMIAEMLESIGCCHGHDGKRAPPMMYPEWIACAVKHHIEREGERCAKVAERACGRAGVNHDEPRCCQAVIAAAIRAGEESE